MVENLCRGREPLVPGLLSSRPSIGMFRVYMRIYSPYEDRLITSAWAQSNDDALILIKAAERGLIPILIRQPTESELAVCIESGTVIVYRTSDYHSTWRHWHDGKAWTLSTLLKRYRVYRQLNVNLPYDRPHERQKNRQGTDANTARISAVDAHIFSDPVRHRAYVNMFGHRLATAPEAEVDGLGKRHPSFSAILPRQEFIASMNEGQCRYHHRTSERWCKLPENERRNWSSHGFIITAKPATINLTPDRSVDKITINFHIT
ncbi:hypothetical protein K474DRAFT_1676442 [Panus rudis PR-1116 ss-1]|nr:hypothetical protein K474DRAFT_1676442 [Panus rudis PR-1116 ss-1]